jgi:uncharacterized protein YgbK (DUF1537 family)
MRVAIVADDLTGALDAAAPFAARGLNTRVAIDAEGLATAIAHTPEVLAVNTATRHADPDAAAERVRACAQELAAHHPGLLIKKIDSTLRGQVASEISAVHGVVRGRVVLCPAVPLQGRTVRGGRVRVDGRPLGASDAGRDRRSAAIADDLAAALGGLPGGARVVDARTAWPEHGHLVVDAESSADLAAVAGRILTQSGVWLPVGAAGLTDALANAAFGPRQDQPVAPPAAPALFVVGSQTARTRAQISALQARASSPGDGDPVLVVPDTDQDGRGDPDAVAADLAARAHRILWRMQPGLVAVAGGDTAHALLRELKVASLPVVDELWPGIVHARIRLADRPVALVTKAGGFGAETLFCDLADWCRKA